MRGRGIAGLVAWGIVAGLSVRDRRGHTLLRRFARRLFSRGFAARQTRRLTWRSTRFAALHGFRRDRASAFLRSLSRALVVEFWHRRLVLPLCRALHLRGGPERVRVPESLRLVRLPWLGGSRQTHGRLGYALTLAVAAGLGCAQLAPTAIDPLEPLPRLSNYVPDDLDRSARDLANAILTGDDDALDPDVARLAALDEQRLLEEGEGPSGLVPYALDARNATIPDRRIRQMAGRALLERDDLEIALRKRVQTEVDDDPLQLAQRRLLDQIILRYGRAANSVIESVGRSGINATLLPYRLAQSVIGIALAEHQQAELTTPERQALGHWKRYVEQHPQAPEAAELLDRIREAQVRWNQTQRDRLVQLAGEALEAEQPVLAGVYADRALRYEPEDPDAAKLRERAEVEAKQQRDQRERSLGVATAVLDALGRQTALATALWAPDDRNLSEAFALASEIQGEGPDAPLYDEAQYVLALSANARGVEGEYWDRIEAIAAVPENESPMARHARTEWYSLERNPYPAFGRAIGAARGARARATAFGPLKDGARDRKLPRWLEWVVEVPALFAVVAGLPQRLLQAPFEETPLGVAAILARRTLERSPGGPHAAEVTQWLIHYEESRGNEVGALALLENSPGASPKAIVELRKAAAEQAYEASLKEKRRDVRLRLLMDVAQRFQGTEGAKQAGEAAREEIRNLTAQKIRISRGFLLENPKVAGPDGLALRPVLLDDEPSNGELHPDGVMLLGERIIEISIQDGRKSDPPKKKQLRVSKERLARLVAQIEESTLHTLRTDRDAVVEYDADRDLFLERARLGTTSNPDIRSHAESNYAFIGMRERYGLVRSRESILPVQLVLQGSFDNFGLGAFPRIRMPKTTPDAVLYKDR